MHTWPGCDIQKTATGCDIQGKWVETHGKKGKGYETHLLPCPVRSVW